MQFNELVGAVIVNTNRPELLAETKLAVRRATTKMHNLDYFLSDLTDGSIIFAVTTRPRIDLVQFGTGFRKFAGINSFDRASGPGQPIPELDGDMDTNIVGQCGYTILGQSLNVYGMGALGGLYFRYYTLPVTDEANYNSWIAVKHPFAIIDEASAVVLASTGNNERAQFFRSLVGNKLPKPNGHIAEILSGNRIGYDSSE